MATSVALIENCIIQQLQHPLLRRTSVCWCKTTHQNKSVCPQQCAINKMPDLLVRCISVGVKRRVNSSRAAENDTQLKIIIPFDKS